MTRTVIALIAAGWVLWMQQQTIPFDGGAGRESWTYVEAFPFEQMCRGVAAYHAENAPIHEARGAKNLHITARRDPAEVQVLTRSGVMIWRYRCVPSETDPRPR